MKKSYFLPLLLVLFFATGCANEQFLSHDNELGTVDNANKYAISVESALEALDTFRKNDPQTRDGDLPAIEETFVIYDGCLGTRSDEAIGKVSAILYVTNFVDNNGYAVMAADSRIGTDILILTELGNLSQAVTVKCIENDYKARHIYDGYPTTGAGVFTDDTYPGEMFMNLNTFSPYDIIPNDTIVGNINLTDLNNIADDVYDNTSLEAEYETDIKYMTTAMCIQYARNRINTYDIRLHNFVSNIDDTDIPSDGDGAGGPGPIDNTIEFNEWKEVIRMNPLLSTMNKWKQTEPFNDYFSSVRCFWRPWKKKRASTGCFPLSIARIFTLEERPNSIVLNGHSVNWSELKRDYTSSIGRESAAILLKMIADGCSCWYFYEGTFTFPSRAISYMKRLGFAAQEKSYNLDIALESLSKNKPLIMYAVPKHWNIFQSHAWNIDGYKVRARTGIVLSTGKHVEETAAMLHCDFGWAGLCNGYYTDGIFKLNDYEHTEFDDPNGEVRNIKYNHYLHLITY